MGVIYGTTTGVIKGDTRSSDNGSCTGASKLKFLSILPVRVDLKLEPFFLLGS